MTAPLTIPGSRESDSEDGDGGYSWRLHVLPPCICMFQQSPIVPSYTPPFTTHLTVEGERSAILTLPLQDSGDYFSHSSPPRLPCPSLWAGSPRHGRDDSRTVNFINPITVGDSPRHLALAETPIYATSRSGDGRHRCKSPPVVRYCRHSNSVSRTPLQVRERSRSPPRQGSAWDRDRSHDHDHRRDDSRGGYRDRRR